VAFGAAQLGDFAAAADGDAEALELVDQVRRHRLREVRAPDNPESLTGRETEVLERLAQGMVNAAIADALHVSQSTVEKHVNAIFDKLGLDRTPGYSRRVLAILRYLDG